MKNDEKEAFVNITEGRNPVMELLKTEVQVEKLLVQKSAKEGSINKIIKLAKDKKIVIIYAEKIALDRLSKTGHHQGVIAYTSEYKYYDVKDLLENNKSNNFIVILDEIQDPHNLGSIIRSANCAGFGGIVIPKRNSALITETVVKASAGATFHTKVAKATNLSQTVDYLKKEGFWVFGADMGGTDYYKADFKGKVALIIGSEGKGISKVLKEKCDFIVSIPMYGEINSLNASVAAGIIMFEAAKQRG